MGLLFACEKSNNEKDDESNDGQSEQSGEKNPQKSFY